MCDYQGREFGANYPDSVCIEGYLWDADSGDAAPDGSGWLYTIGGDLPCPKCNHEEWLERQCEEVTDRGYAAADEGVAESACPYNSCPLRYEEDREALKAAWLKGYRSRLAEDSKASVEDILFVHKDIPGEHVFDGASCWCNPLPVRKADVRPTEEIQAEAERCDG